MSTYAGRSAAFAALVLLISGCASVEETVRVETPTNHARVVAAYHPWWTQSAWRGYDPALYDEVFFFSVEIDSTGGIAERNGWPDRWFDMQRTLADRGVRVTPVVTLFSQATFERLFAAHSASSRLQETLLGLLRDSPATGGLQLDFEVYQPVSDSVRDGFTTFVRELRGAMNGLRPGLRLSAYVVAYDEADVFDEAALADAVDYLVVQGYDLHSRGEGRTGPVAALDGWGRRNWRTIVSRLVDLGVPRTKIVMSVPYFGYEWPAASDEPGARTVGSGRTIAVAAVDSTIASGSPPSALERAEQHGLLRDPDSGSPYYVYEDTTGWRQGWFEDAESLERKYRYVVEEGLRGVAVFPPAYGTEEMAEVLGALLKSAPLRSGSQ